jgi:hypothetical protein
MARLRDKVREDLQLRGLWPATIDTYIRCARSRLVEALFGAPSHAISRHIHGPAASARVRGRRCHSRTPA